MKMISQKYTPEELDFPASPEYTKDDIARVQKRLLEMADAIISILDAHEIDYMICYGTLLGAVRHGGFIPWDDDLDIFLFDKDYQRALEVLRAELPSDMIVHDEETDPIFWPYWARVRDLTTDTYAELYPKDNKFKYHGLSFDLFPLERVRKDRIKYTELMHNREYFKKLLRADLISEEECKKGIEGVEAALAELEANPREDADEAYAFCGWYECDNDEELFPLKTYEFEGRTFKGPANPDVMLKKMYGNYWELPPFEKRKPHYSWVKFSGENDD